MYILILKNLSPFGEAVREDINDLSVFEGNTLADEETHLDLQNQYVEAFYHESQDIERDFLKRTLPIKLSGWYILNKG